MEESILSSDWDPDLETASTWDPDLETASIWDPDLETVSVEPLFSGLEELSEEMLLVLVVRVTLATSMLLVLVVRVTLP